VISIDDLAHPQLTEAQSGTLAWGETVSVDFSEAAILDSARAKTGLDDFGAGDFRVRLGILREEWDNDRNITPFHRTVLHSYLVRYACNRLLIQDALKKHPEIHEQRIECPLIVAGLPRSGTTHLVNLLAADERFHSLPLWESYEPVPMPGENATGDALDPRYVRCEQAWEGMQRVTPLIAAMHPMNPEHIHEELELMGPDFASYNFEWLTLSPRWRDHYLNTDQTPHYEYMKTVLKLLQWQRVQRGQPHKRWVLKCPQHLEQLAVLKNVFPDATLAITHRDPVAVIQSTVTMQAYTQRMNRKTVAMRELIDYWPARVERLLRACVRDRAAWPEAQSIDVPFHEFMADDMGMVEKIYAKAGLPLTERARAQLEQFIADHPRGKEGRMHYNLERDFGVSPQALRERFGFYFDSFPARAER